MDNSREDERQQTRPTQLYAQSFAPRSLPPLSASFPARPGRLITPPSRIFTDEAAQSRVNPDNLPLSAPYDPFSSRGFHALAWDDICDPLSPTTLDAILPQLRNLTTNEPPKTTYSAVLASQSVSPPKEDASPLSPEADLRSSLVISTRNWFVLKMKNISWDIAVQDIRAYFSPVKVHFVFPSWLTHPSNPSSSSATRDQSLLMWPSYIVFYSLILYRPSISLSTAQLERLTLVVSLNFRHLKKLKTCSNTSQEASSKVVLLLSREALNVNSWRLFFLLVQRKMTRSLLHLAKVSISGARKSPLSCWSARITRYASFSSNIGTDWTQQLHFSRKCAERPFENVHHTPLFPL